jgi:hypothetical protein
MTEQPTKVKRAGSVAMHIILPFWSMRQTVRLAKREANKTKDNWASIVEMSADAKKALLGNKEIEAGQTTLPVSFEEAMANRKPGAMSQDQLYLFFLRRKRAALLAVSLFWVFGLIGLGGGVLDGSAQVVIQSGLSLVSSSGLLFALALSAQLRLWQLETRRLSAEERGGLKDYMSENPTWIRQTLSPQYSTKKGASS